MNIYFVQTFLFKSHYIKHGVYLCVFTPSDKSIKQIIFLLTLTASEKNLPTLTSFHIYSEELLQKKKCQISGKYLFKQINRSVFF